MLFLSACFELNNQKVAKQLSLNTYGFIRQDKAWISMLGLKKNVRVAILRKHFSD